MNSAPTFPTPACILRAAAAYVLNNGLHLPVQINGETCHVDWSTDPLTPAASPEGAIRMVVFGHPTLDAITREDGELYMAALEAYLVACAGQELRLRQGMQLGAWSTPDGVARMLLWAAMSWELDCLACPGCRGPVSGLPDWSLTVTARVVIPVYRHYPQLSPLCGDETAPTLPVYQWGDGCDA
jgi:hypothetical protein